MQDNVKKSLGLIILIALVVLAVYYFNQRDSGKQANPHLLDKVAEPPAEKTLSFVTGTVTSTAGGSIVFQSDGGQELEAVVDSETVLQKQTVQEDGTLVIEAAVLADFANSAVIVVQPGPTGGATEFTAEKIQKIN